MKIQRHTVKAPGTLEACLAEVLVGARTTRIRQLLRFHSVSVNGAEVTRGAHALQVGDVVEIDFSKEKGPPRRIPGGLRIVREDEHIIVIDKPPGLLSMASDKERERTAYALLTEHVRERRPQARVFIVHRLDQGTSGLLLFARTEAVKRALQDAWKEVDKGYLAVVEGTPVPPEGTVRSRLKESSALRVYASDEGAEAVTHYRTLATKGGRSLLEITLETGRKNQIRVHLADLGCPVVGDRKYGARTDPAGRLALHSARLAFTHPVTGERITLESPLPPGLRALV